MAKLAELEAMTKAGLPRADFQMNYFFAASFPRVYVVSEKTREKTREKIINLILEDKSITTEMIAKEVGITAKGVEYQIDKMKKDGILKRIGPDKGGYWKVLDNE